MSPLFYDTLKILHILGATLVLSSLAYCIALWHAMPNADNSYVLFARIQKQTALIIMPLGTLQLLSGVTLISLQHTALGLPWLYLSFAGFIGLMTCWLGFMYCLTMAQQNTLQNNDQKNPHRRAFYRRAQTYMLAASGIALAVILFAMTSRLAHVPGNG